jgi:site-specific DNA-methyltransferase (adenine-specific)
MTPYYQDEWATIYHGDCREVLPQISERVNLCVTDPPYGETSLAWDYWPQGWPELLMGLTDQMWCFGSARMFMDKKEEFNGWKFAQDVVWEKHNGSGLHTDRFRRVHELVFQFYQGGWDAIYHVTPVTMDATKRTVKRANKPKHWGALKSFGTYNAKDGDPRLMRSVMFCKSMHRFAEHPVQNPVEIIMPLIQYSTRPGDVVLDPFGGSGSTALAAKLTRRKCILIEGGLEYCEVSKQRLIRDVPLFAANAMTSTHGV